MPLVVSMKEGEGGLAVTLGRFWDNGVFYFGYGNPEKS
jgi:hypothetical protein